MSDMAEYFEDQDEMRANEEGRSIYSKSLGNLSKPSEPASDEHTASTSDYRFEKSIGISPLMTGQGWFDRFEQELIGNIPWLSDSRGIVKSKVIEAAKRASGLTKEGE